MEKSGLIFPYAKRSPSHKAVGSHTHRPSLEVSLGGADS